MRSAVFLRQLCCLLLLLVVAAAAAPGKNTGSNRVEIVAVDHPNVRPAAGTDPGKIGNVQMVLPDGTVKALTKSGLAFDVKAVAKGKILGWLEGQIQEYPDRDQPITKNGYPTVPTFFPKYLVLRREGRLRQIVPEKLYLVEWKFLKDGKQVGIKSEGSHGPTYLQLFDTATGKLLDSRRDSQEHLPAWTREL